MLVFLNLGSPWWNPHGAHENTVNILSKIIVFAVCHSLLVIDGAYVREWQRINRWEGL
jgi:hypothetical protein